MQCPACQTQNDPGSKFCLACGSALAAEAPAELGEELSGASVPVDAPEETPPVEGADASADLADGGGEPTAEEPAAPGTASDPWATGGAPAAPEPGMPPASMEPPPLPQAPPPPAPLPPAPAPPGVPAAGYAPASAPPPPPGYAAGAPAAPGWGTPAAPPPPAMPVGPPDPNGLGAAVARLGNAARRNTKVAVAVAGALLEDGEMVEAAVGGKLAGNAALLVLTDRGLLLVDDRQWKPVTERIAVDAMLQVQGWQDDRTASLTLIVGGQQILVDGISDRPLAVEMAQRIRYRTGG